MNAQRKGMSQSIGGIGSGANCPLYHGVALRTLKLKDVCYLVAIS